METIEQTINGAPTTNGNSTVTISRNGDLRSQGIYISSYFHNGDKLISEVELEIGGQRIDRTYR